MAKKTKTAKKTSTKSTTKKTKTTGKTVRRLLSFPLTDTDKAERGMDAARVKREKTELEAEFTRIKKEYQARITTKQSTIDTLLNEIDTGTEQREVQCEEVKNFEAQRVEYYFEGELRDSRDMVEADRQEELPLETKEKKNWKRDGKMAAANDDTFRDEDPVTTRPAPETTTETTVQ